MTDYMFTSFTVPIPDDLLAKTPEWVRNNSLRYFVTEQRFPETGANEPVDGYIDGASAVIFVRCNEGTIAQDALNEIRKSHTMLLHNLSTVDNKNDNEDNDFFEDDTDALPLGSPDM